MPSTSAIIETPLLDSVSTQDLYRELLIRIGEDPTRDGLLRTPERMEKSMAFLTRGYTMNVTAVLHEALFDVDYDEMVIVKDVSFSPCANIICFLSSARPTSHTSQMGRSLALAKFHGLWTSLHDGYRCRSD